MEIATMMVQIVHLIVFSYPRVIFKKELGSLDGNEA